MDVVGLGWTGTRTSAAQQMARFHEQVLGLELEHTEPDFWVFRLPGGQHVEVFGERFPGKDHFSTGPVVGFAVADLAGAVTELRDAGVELLGQAGPSWQHFRAPDGNVYELVTAP